MNLNEMVLCDDNGNFHYQGCIAKPFQHYYTRAEWFVVVGELTSPEHKIWMAQGHTLDMRMLAVSAIDWYLKTKAEVAGAPIPPLAPEAPMEICNEQPAV